MALRSLGPLSPYRRAARREVVPAPANVGPPKLIRFDLTDGARRRRIATGSARVAALWVLSALLVAAAVIGACVLAELRW